MGLTEPGPDEGWGRRVAEWGRGAVHRDGVPTEGPAWREAEGRKLNVSFGGYLIALGMNCVTKNGIRDNWRGIGEGSLRPRASINYGNGSIGNL